MTPKLKLSENLVQRLHSIKEEKLGALYGLMYDGILLVVGMSVEVEGTSFQELQSHFPTEVDFCGIVTFSSENNNELSPNATDSIQEVIVSDNPLLLKRVYGNSNSINAYFYCNQKLVEVQYDILSESDICELFVHIRLKTQLPFVCELSSEAIFESINSLQKKVSSGTVAFHVLNTSVYLFGTEMEDPSPSVCDLYKMAVFNHIEGTVGQQGKKLTVSQSLQNINVMNISMMQKCTRDGQTEGGCKSAPVIHHIKSSVNGEFVERLKVVLPIDALCMVHYERKASELYNVLVDSLCRSLRLLERNLSRGSQPPTMPWPYHFLPSNLGHFFTIVYPKKSDDELTSVRRTFHKQFCLPENKPIFRKGNAHVFKDGSCNSQAILINPHVGLPPSGVKDGEVALVQGNYSYHHYMQDKKNDNGWGCAYRSLQTLVSWFRLQGYTDKNIPTHEDIQKCLVDIGDKPPSFIGSSLWIGSTEVNYVLDSLFGITCRIMNVSSGEELGEKGSELLMHFKTQGTPIMIGGGVLAHTILGVDYNKHTGDLRFLILDPHYTGSEDERVIQNKGWVGWKKVSFWDKKSFYNLCMPVRPLCI
ncbi:UFM1 specific peptidase 2 [Lycorma delicatula]|uniref:UFM1 specific peptidase 2 n=1 Tax=Lycorma delicatula TaxID=130591 RepID=UPI003F510A35